MPDGFIQAVTPENGATGVPLSTQTIVVQYNQPMRTSAGGGEVDHLGSYALYQWSEVSRRITIIQVTYDATTYAATLTLDTTNSNWMAGTWYELGVKGNVKNIAGTNQGGDVFTHFQTGS